MSNIFQICKLRCRMPYGVMVSTVDSLNRSFIWKHINENSANKQKPFKQKYLIWR